MQGFLFVKYLFHTSMMYILLTPTNQQPRRNIKQSATQLLISLPTNFTVTFLNY